MLSNRVSQSDFLLFNRQLVSLIETDLPLPNSLAMLSKESRHPALRSAIQGLQRAVEAGEPLSSAVAARPDVFPKLYAKIIEAGEKSNNLVGVLAQFVKYSESIAELKERLKDVLMYPAFVLVSALAVFSMLVFVVLPTTARTVLTLVSGNDPDVLSRDRGEVWVQLLRSLPGTMPIIAACVLGLIGLIVLAWIALRMSGGGRTVLDRIMLKVPAYGQCYRLSLLSRFSETLGLLIQSHVPLGDALYLAGQCSPSATLRGVSVRLQHSVEAGRKLNDAMAAEPLLGPTLPHMVSIGQQREALHEELQSAAELFGANLRVRARRLAVSIDAAALSAVACLVFLTSWLMFTPIQALIRGMSGGMVD